MKKSLYYKTSTQNGPVDFADRWNDIKPLIDFNPNHIVLDVGCAEGLFNQNAYEKGATNSVGIDIFVFKIFLK